MHKECETAQGRLEKKIVWLTEPIQTWLARQSDSEGFIYFSLSLLIYFFLFAFCGNERGQRPSSALIKKRLSGWTFVLFVLNRAHLLDSLFLRIRQRYSAALLTSDVTPSVVFFQNTAKCSQLSAKLSFVIKTKKRGRMFLPLWKERNFCMANEYWPCSVKMWKC